MNTIVREHYTSQGIVDRVLRAANYDRNSKGPLPTSTLYPFDQFHAREIIATRLHCDRLAPTNNDHVLDVGCGIGGPARYLASTFGCHVSGVDITPAFIETACDLTHLCELDKLASFTQGEASSMPFDDGTFDSAICFYVGMNLPDKAAVLSECWRVLKSGGKLLWTEVVTDSGDPHFPLPWATLLEGSFLNTGRELQAHFDTAGFVIDSQEDETNDIVELARANQSKPLPPALVHEANATVLGPDFVNRRKNFIRSLAEGRISSVFISSVKQESAHQPHSVQ